MYRGQRKTENIRVRRRKRGHQLPSLDDVNLTAGKIIQSLTISVDRFYNLHEHVIHECASAGTIVFMERTAIVFALPKLGKT
jgi:hypothetical protein